MSRRKCIYNKEWEENPAYKDWVQPLKSDKTNCICLACDRVVDISNMGESALKQITEARAVLKQC